MGRTGRQDRTVGGHGTVLLGIGRARVGCAWVEWTRAEWKDQALSERGQRSLADVELLADLPGDELGALEQRCRWRTYRVGEQIIDRHSESRDIFFVADGRVRVVNYSLSGREVSFDDIDAGGFFGELSAIDGEPRSAAVVALTQVTLAALSPRLFADLLTTHPGVGLHVMRRLARIIRQSTSRIMDLSTLGANNRVHAELLRQARKASGDSNTAVIRPVPVHSDIASRVSTTRETVARVLGDLTRAGIVRRQGNALVIDDVDRLSEMVEEVRGE